MSDKRGPVSLRPCGPWSGDQLLVVIDGFSDAGIDALQAPVPGDRVRFALRPGDRTGHGLVIAVLPPGPSFIVLWADEPPDLDWCPRCNDDECWCGVGR